MAQTIPTLEYTALATWLRTEAQRHLVDEAAPVTRPTPTELATAQIIVATDIESNVHGTDEVNVGQARSAGASPPWAAQKSDPATAVFTRSSGMRRSKHVRQSARRGSRIVASGVGIVASLRKRGDLPAAPMPHQTRLGACVVPAWSGHTISTTPP